MIVNGKALLNAYPFEHMLVTKEKKYGYSHGLSEAGYDIRIAQDIFFYPGKYVLGLKIKPEHIVCWQKNAEWSDEPIKGRFCLASTIEKFQMPLNLTGIVHDKSTWARQGLSVFNTVIEPGWAGFLTLELAFNGEQPLEIPSGVGIAQVIFHKTTEKARYDGKYQNATAGPQKAIFEK